MFLLLCDFFVNRDHLAVLAHALELHFAVDQSKQSVVLPLTDIVAGVDLGSALSEQHVAGFYELTVGSLRTNTLGFVISTVLV